MVHRDGALASREIRLPLWLFRFLTITAIVLSVVLVLSAVLYAPIVRTAARVPGLNREVAQLREENSQVRYLAARLGQMEQQYEQVRTMLGSDVVPPRTRTYNAVVVQPLLARGPSEESLYEEGLSPPQHWPLEVRGIVTRGTIIDAEDGERHTGVDIAVPIGTPIRACGGATVASAGWDPEYGLFVLLEHPEGYESMYGHASRILAEVGDTVQAGEVIALSGSTGRSTAPHLHFEVLHEGQPIDPRSLVQEGS
jgi:murein DD-endopeptidase MepM/ murein hydrolase activator NlpD